MNGFPYLHETTLRGHEESVTAMEFSPDGRFLASGSEDGLLLIFSTLEWKLVRRDRIFCGFKGGDVHTVQFDPLKTTTGVWTDTFEGPIHFLTHHPNQNKLVIGSGHRVLLAECDILEGFKTALKKIRQLPTPPPFPSFPGELPDPVGRSAHYVPEKSTVLVSYLHHGIVCWDLESLRVVWRIVPRSFQIGRSSISFDKQTIVVTNLYNGVDCYSLLDQSLIDSVRVDITDNYPTPVAFDERGVIAFGGSSGAVQIACLSPPTIVQVLDMGGALVQALAYTSATRGRYLLAAGTAEQGKDTIVRIWGSRPNNDVGFLRKFDSWLGVILFLVLLFCTHWYFGRG